jgi:hypothetical protein
MAVRLSALRAGRPLVPVRFLNNIQYDNKNKHPYGNRNKYISVAVAYLTILSVTNECMMVNNGRKWLWSALRHYYEVWLEGKP